MNQARGRRRTMQGTVVGDAMNKTVVVRVERLTRHRLYHRTLRRGSRFKAHDEENACRIGDVVRITECRPLSKQKRWRVTEIVRRAR